MPTAQIALIEGDETETEFIENRILSRIESARWEHFESLEEFRQSDRSRDTFKLVISDLLEEYTEDMSDDEVVDQLASSFKGLLETDEDTRPPNISFLTKVPIGYIEDAIKQEIHLFPEAERSLGESLSKSGVTRYKNKREGIAVVEKPYWKDDDGELIDIDDDNLPLIRDIWRSKLQD